MIELSVKRFVNVYQSGRMKVELLVQSIDRKNNINENLLVYNTQTKNVKYFETSDLVKTKNIIENIQDTILLKKETDTLSDLFMQPKIFIDRGSNYYRVEANGKMTEVDFLDGIKDDLVYVLSLFGLTYEECDIICT